MAILPPLTAFSVLVAAYIVLMPLSFHAVVRATGRDGGVLTAVAALTAFNWSYWLGEASFFLGQPLVLLAFALFLRIRRCRSGAFVGFLIVSVLTYFCHFFALGALFVAVASLAPLGLPALREAVDPRFRWSAARLAAAAALTFLFLLGCYYVLLHQQPEHGRGVFSLDLSVRKLAQIGLVPFDAPDTRPRWLTPAFLAMVAGALIVPHLHPASSSSGWSGWRQAFEPVLLLPAIALVAAALLSPQRLLETSGATKDDEIAVRFCLCAFLFCLAASRVPRSPVVRATLLVATDLFVAVKLAGDWSVHHRYDTRMREISTRLFSQVPPGSRVLPLKDLSAANALDNLYHRAGNYVVVQRHSYSPHVFAVIGQQPLRHVKGGDHRSVSLRAVSDAEWAYYDFVLVQTDRDTPAVPGLEDHGVRLGQVGPFLLYGLHVKKGSW